MRILFVLLICILSKKIEINSIQYEIFSWSVFLALSKISPHCFYEEPPPPHVDSRATFNGDYDVTERIINKVSDYKGKIR